MLVTKAAIEVFMSEAPRPYSTPSRMVGVKGSETHCSSGPLGTTSVWPAKHTTGASLPLRAHRLVTPLDSMVSNVKPSGARRAISRAWQPASSGVLDCLEIRSLASAKVSFMGGEVIF